MKRIRLSIYLIVAVVVFFCLSFVVTRWIIKTQHPESSMVKQNSSQKKHKEPPFKKENQTSKQLASGDTANFTSQKQNNQIITTSDQAERLVEHAMATEPGTYQAVPVDGGFRVSRPDLPGLDMIVKYNGDIQYSDGSYQSYAEVSGPDHNGTFTP